MKTLLVLRLVLRLGVVHLHDVGGEHVPNSPIGIITGAGIQALMI